MASYGLKYYAEFLNQRGQEYRLEIHRRGYNGGSTKIGTLAGCLLEVQGNMGSIIAPIIKTQLRFTVLDAPDIPTAGTGAKFGDWQEFFTPDSTLYKVVLKCWISNAWAAEWTGYITPDSWQESLDYHGAITITARDGLGHLKDFQFKASDLYTDEYGLDLITNILYKAMDIIDFPMDFTTNGAYIPISEDGHQVDGAYVNASLFEGMNWYDVLEQTLEAIGFVLRFVGGNMCVFSSLAQMPNLGEYGTPSTQALEFYGGTLELDPAVKRIVEEQDYKEENEVSLEVMEGLQFQTPAGTYRCKMDGNPWPSNPSGHTTVLEHDAPVQLVTGSGKTGWDVGSGMLDPTQYTPDGSVKRAEGEEGWRKYAFVAACQVPNSQGTSPNATYTFKTRTAAVKVTFKFTPSPMSIRDEGGFAGLAGVYTQSLYRIKYYVMFTDGTTTKYWDGGGWGNNAFLMEQTFDSEHQHETDFVIEMGECSEIAEGSISIRLSLVEYKCFYDSGDGCYARVGSITAEINSTTVLKSNKVTTVNNDAYNVILNRKPLFGALSQEMSFVKPSNYLAGLFYYPVPQGIPAVFPYQVKFDGQNTTVPLPVLIHEQILCYYYGAARVLQGSCGVPNNALFRFNKLCTYKGHTYLFQGGTMDYFTGIISNATFREFAYWDDMFSSAPPSYDEQTEYNR